MVNIQTEIRKLPSAQNCRLTKILDDCNSWVELIEIIPNDNGDQFKYNSNHKRLIEEEAKHYGRSCSEILLDEWGTSGRRRPTLGLLLELLIKADLYAAADYVSQVILKDGTVPRPLEGPAAKVDVLLLETSSTSEGINNKNYAQDKNYTKRFTPLHSTASLNTSGLQIRNIPDMSDLLTKMEVNTSVDMSNSTMSTNASFAADYFPDFEALKIFPQSAQNSAVLSNNISAVNGNDIFNQSIQTTSNSVYEIPNLSELNLNNSNFRTSQSVGTFFAKPDINVDIPYYSYEELRTHTNNFSEISFDENGSKLGSGAFGSVYFAAGLQVAVKKLHTINGGNTNQFKNEIEIMSKCKHRNLLKLLGYSIDGPTYCLVYEFMSGGCLKERLQNQNNILTSKPRVEIAVGCAEAIAFLHSINIIHRDIKSANILLDNMDQPKLSDFGLVKETPVGLSSMEATTISGTSAYMSPEAHRGDISMKMDCYSFGVVLLELITGLPSLDAQREDRDLVTHVYAHANEGIDNLVDKRIDLWITPARELYRVAANCLLEKRERPFMKDILEELKKILIT